MPEPHDLASCFYEQCIECMHQDRWQYQYPFLRECFESSHPPTTNSTSFGSLCGLPSYHSQTMSTVEKELLLRRVSKYAGLAEEVNAVFFVLMGVNFSASDARKHILQQSARSQHHFV